MSQPTIYFDLDGVIRELNQTVLGYQPTAWESSDGNHLITTIHKNPSILLETKPTEYYNTIIRLSHKYHLPINILSHQPKHWQPYTTTWLKTYIKPYTNLKTIYTDSSNQKLDYLTHENTYLIDDCPGLASSDKVVLIDKPYNRDVIAKYRRINGPEELEDWFRAMYA